MFKLIPASFFGIGIRSLMIDPHKKTGNVETIPG
jgi:hypothetical protein